MKLNLLFILMLIMALSFNNVYSQGVSINEDGSDPDETAILDIKSSDKGLLIPRMSSDEIRSIAHPADGLQVYNTDEGKLYIYVLTDDNWKEVSFGTGILEPFFVCGDQLIDSREDNAYATVEINGQCWMAENLRETKLTNGTIIPYESQSYNWANATSYKYCYYNNANYYSSTYGCLYNFYAVNTGMLCPEGWHVPSDEEWEELITAIGGVNYGYKLKEEGTTHWLTSPNPGTNETGFTGRGSGIRYNNGTFEDLKISGNYWSSTQNGSTATWYYLRSYYGNISNWQSSLKQGISVRCVKD